MSDATEAIAAVVENREMEDNVDGRYSPIWQEASKAILFKLAMEVPFFNRVVKEFAKNDWATQLSARKVMNSLAAGIAVYGKLTDNQFELGMKILREHTSRLVNEYAKDVGIVLEDSDLPY